MKHYYMVNRNMINDGRMKENRALLIFKMGCLLLLWLFPGVLGAQDRLPVRAPKSHRMKRQKPYRAVYSLADTIAVTDSFPLRFRGMGDNLIENQSTVLDSIFSRLREMLSGNKGDTLHIVHIGDSHVRGHIFPQRIGELLTRTFQGIDYVDMGVNGATCLTFTHPNRIMEVAKRKPDLLILSFGTNESHNRSYQENPHYHQMNELISLLRDSLPKIPIILTTPPGSFERIRYRRRRSRYVVNPRTEKAVTTIKRYANAHQLAVWDLYTAVGGRQRACENWIDSGLMRPDHVHFFADGYLFQGDLFYRAFIKAYNKYVVSH